MTCESCPSFPSVAADSAAYFDGADWLYRNDPALNGSFPSGSDSSLNGFTIAAVIRPSRIDRRQPLLAKQTLFGPGFLFGLKDKRLEFISWPEDRRNPSVIRSSEEIESNSLTHVAVTYTKGGGGVAQLYVDGQPNGPAVRNFGGTPRGNSAPLEVGRGIVGGIFSRYFKGSIADIKVYAEALDARQIRELNRYGEVRSPGSILDTVNDPGTFARNLNPDGELKVLAQGPLSNPTFALWSGFLSMINIAELVNPGDEELVATLSLYSINGRRESRTTVVIPPRGQRDVIVNGLEGFVSDSYGILEIAYKGGELDGRLSFYRQEGSSGDYEFAFGVPFPSLLYGTNAVGFNTMQPSQKLEERLNAVSNWFSVVNLAKSPKRFTVNEYTSLGTLLQTKVISVAPFGRVDLEAGAARPPTVGLIEVVAADKSAPYLAHLMRYGADTPPGQFPSGYHFAFPLGAEPGSNGPLYVPNSRQYGEQAWVETMNLSDDNVTVLLKFIAQTGEIRGEKTFVLPTHAQVHVDGSEYLHQGEIGYVSITPDGSGVVAAQTMFYFRKNNGQVSAMYGIQGREALGNDLSGSTNRFLEILPSLRLYNVSDEPIQAIVSVGNASQHQIDIQKRGAVELKLYDEKLFNTKPNTYDIIKVETAGEIFVEVIRSRWSSNVFGGERELDFVAPTQVK